MQLVVDANILLAAFLKKAVTREFLLDSRLNLAAPEHLLSETLRHLRRDASIRKRIGLPIEEIEALFLQLTHRIQVFPQVAYRSFMKEALALAAHHEDAPYLALALMLKAVVWSNDKGMKQQATVTVYSTSELLAILQQMSG
ncbi:MAG TPA: PIN domain-containing protein [Candidatus Omnitrophota bacterium]|nr:PIN domain-containing protein [Candidatus Omnitrophota bacterium]